MTDLELMGKKAAEAKYRVQELSAREKDHALLAAAEALTANTDKILQANALDIAAGEAAGMREGLLDRLRLTAGPRGGSDGAFHPS